MAGAPFGNTNGRKENRLFTDTLRRYYTQNPDKVRTLVELLDRKAQEGDLATAREVMDRVDGKSIQSTEVSGPEGGAIEFASLTPAEARAVVLEKLKNPLVREFLEVKG